MTKTARGGIILLGEFVTILTRAKIFALLSKNKTKGNMKNKSIIFITHGAVTASLYVALTYLSSLLGLASGPIQIRLSEALTVLPFFTPAAVPGLFIGCLLANLLTGAAPLDVIFGSLTTLVAALLTYLLRKYKFLAPVPPIILNTAVLPFLFRYVYGMEGAMLYFALTVFIGEFISCGVLGYILLNVLKRYEKIFSLK